MADFERGDVAHLLRRSGFASPTAKVDALVAKASWAEVVEAVLDTRANPPDTIPAAVDDRDPQRERLPALVAALRYWLDRMATTPTPIVERMTFFWHGILPSAVFDPLPRLVFRQLRTYRARGLGDVHDLLQAMAIDPAMLIYLDNATNVAGNPNENFARELMELFTMGNGTFSEADVVAMARAWTGHNLDRATERYVYRPGRHDNGSKTLFGITRAWDGPAALTEIVRGSQQRTCATYLARRLWSHLAAPNPSTELVDGLADTFIAGRMDVKALLRAIFLHPEFRSAATKVALVRSPVEWIVAGMVATGLTSSQLTLDGALPAMGQIPMKPPNVSGWRQNSAWISSSAQWAKANVAIEVRGAVDRAGTFRAWADLSAPAAVQAAFDRFGIDAPSAATRSALEAFVTDERAAGRGVGVPATLAAVTLLTPDFQLA